MKILILIAACLTLAFLCVPGTAQAQLVNSDQQLSSRDLINSEGIRQDTNLITQKERQNLGDTAPFNSKLLDGMDANGSYNDTYFGFKKFWSNDIASDFFNNIGQLLGGWAAQWTDGWVADTVGFLTGILQAFVLNPNIAGQGPGDDTTGDDISPAIREGATLMHAIAIDLLLVLFLLAIWRYWTQEAWRGGEGVMGAVGRLVFTCAISLGWPLICYLEIRLSNQMIETLCLGLSGQTSMLDAAMSNSVRDGLFAFSGTLVASAFTPVLSRWGLAHAGIPIAGFISSIAVVVLLILGIILIAQLVFMLVMKAVQMALLVAQFLFAPLFLVFFAVPDTQNIASGFIRSCFEVSLWTFAWVGLLKIMSILLFSAFNPWGKIVMAIAILQLMIKVPAICAQGNISPISQLVSAGLSTQRLVLGAAQMGSALMNGSMTLAGSLTGQGASKVSAAIGQPLSRIAGNEGSGLSINYPACERNATSINQQAPPRAFLEKYKSPLLVANNGGASNAESIVGKSGAIDLATAKRHLRQSSWITKWTTNQMDPNDHYGETEHINSAGLSQNLPDNWMGTSDGCAARHAQGQNTRVPHRTSKFIDDNSRANPFSEWRDGQSDHHNLSPKTLWSCHRGSDAIALRPPRKRTLRDDFRDEALSHLSPSQFVTSLNLSQNSAIASGADSGKDFGKQNQAVPTSPVYDRYLASSQSNGLPSTISARNIESSACEQWHAHSANSMSGTDKIERLGQQLENVSTFDNDSENTSPASKRGQNSLSGFGLDFDLSKTDLSSASHGIAQTQDGKWSTRQSGDPMSQFRPRIGQNPIAMAAGNNRNAHHFRYFKRPGGEHLPSGCLRIAGLIRRDLGAQCDQFRMRRTRANSTLPLLTLVENAVGKDFHPLQRSPGACYGP